MDKSHGTGDQEVAANPTPGEPVALPASTSAQQLLASLPPAERVREQARRLGAVQRQCKVDPYALLMTVVLGIAVRGPTAIAQLGHVLAHCTGLRLARSSFWYRFTPSFEKLVRWLLDLHVQDARRDQRPLPAPLHRFRDVIAVDATVVKVHDQLEPIWRGTRRNSAKAALKVHAWVRVFSGELLKYRLTPDAYGDSRAFGIDHELRGCLVLFDRAYSSPSLWRRVQSVGGYFLTRLPADRNPRILRGQRRHRGRARPAENRKLRRVLEGLQRKYLDVSASFRCKVRRYGREKNRWEEAEFRVVGVRNRKTGRYDLFVTNAPPELLPAEAVASTYALRWEVETFFKTAKSGEGLVELPSRQAHIVRTLIYATLLRATAAMQALARFRRQIAHPCGLLVNPQQWLKWWNRNLHLQLQHIFAAFETLAVDDLALLLADPNVGRPTRRARFLLSAYTA